MYCRQCGYKMADGECFCTQCGTPVAQVSRPADPGAAIWPTAGHEGAGWQSQAAVPPPVWQGAPYGQPAMDAARPKSRKKPLVIALIAVGCALVLAAGVLVPVLIEEERAGRYETAMGLMDNEEYEAAIAAFAEMGDYRDAPEMAEECRSSMDYDAAQALMDAGEYEQACKGFAALGSYRDAEDKAQECQNIMDYNEAQGLMNAREYSKARDLFTALGEYRDARDKAKLCQNILDYEAAQAAMDEGRYADAKNIFDRLGSYEDSAFLSAECQNNIDYIAADEAYNSGFFFTAYKRLSLLSGFSDASARAEACIQPPPASAELYHQPDYAKKISVYIKNKGKSLGLMVKFYAVDGGELVSTVYVAPGKKVKIRLPRGKYMCKCAWGPQWFGDKEYFGDNAFYEWDYEEWELRSGYYYTYEITTPDAGDLKKGSLTYQDF